MTFPRSAHLGSWGLMACARSRNTRLIDDPLAGVAILRRGAARTFFVRRCFGLFRVLLTCGGELFQVDLVLCAHRPTNL